MAHQTVILSHCQISTRSRWQSRKPVCFVLGRGGVVTCFLAQQEMLTSEGLKENEKLSHLSVITRIPLTIAIHIQNT